MKFRFPCNAQDPRYADKVYKANYKNVKVGKAKSLTVRMGSYFKTFGEEIVVTNISRSSIDYSLAEALKRKTYQNEY